MPTQEYETKRAELQKEIDGIEDFFEKMEASQKLIDLDIEYGKIKPNSGEHYECIGCSS